MIFLLLLLVGANLSDDCESAGCASREIPGDEDPYRWLPIGRSDQSLGKMSDMDTYLSLGKVKIGKDRSLGKVKMSDSYASVALHHSADTLTDRKQEWSLLTAGSRTINSQLEDETEKANSNGFSSTVYPGQTTPADEGHNSIEHILDCLTTKL